MILLRAFSLIFLFTITGNFISDYFSTVIPGSIIGMLLLFTALVLKWVPADWVRPGCELMMRHMTVLFVPVCVGLIEHGELIRNHGVSLLLSNLSSSLLVFVLIGVICQRGLK
ncbi:CidA/LrgA family protein [Thaumasiovibrio sp. DFM-14]|uniref:CidA/LrgA family protein n=1 Tax=Thaumasiovibrio sp. DFM-14 TaxID=3384792 RepID=UPI0039A22633